MASLTDIRAKLPGVLNNDFFDMYPDGVTWTITDVVDEEIGADKELKTVVKFRETNKTCVLSASRIDQLEELFGKGIEAKELRGKRVKLIKEPFKAGNREYVGICFREAE